MTSKTTLTISAKYVWELVFDYDNSGNSGEITHSYDFVESGSYTSQTFNETVSSEARKLFESKSIHLESGISYRPVSASVKAGYETSNEVNSMLENTIKEQSEETVSWSTKETRNCEQFLDEVYIQEEKILFTDAVGGYGRLILYQRNFYGPGMSVQDSALRATSVPLSADEMEEEVLIELELEPKVFISNIKVVYGEQATDAPGDRIRDWFNGSDDINRSFGGKYVWLVPEWTKQVSQALTNVDLVIQGQADTRYDDLAKGAGGNYRYLIPVKRSNQKLFISALTLARSEDALNDIPEQIWCSLPQGATNDIDKGRHGDFLYLVWELQRAYEV